jgi:hypothetical protein
MKTTETLFSKFCAAYPVLVVYGLTFVIFTNDYSHLPLLNKVVGSVCLVSVYRYLFGQIIPNSLDLAAQKG